MFSVFLVEDEIIVREGLRKTIQWEQLGYSYAGDASDGDMALPMLRELRPDLLITDIKMPFMDGLALSESVRRELPRTKIVILSGYDDFSYAQQAIRMGVERYILKPVTKDKIEQILRELRGKMEEEHRQEDYLQKFRREVKAYETFSHRRLFERLVRGERGGEEIGGAAGAAELDISAEAYNLVLFTLGSNANSGSAWEGYTDAVALAEDRIAQFFPAHEEFLLCQWNPPAYLVLIRGGAEEIERLSRACVEAVREICEAAQGRINWHIACGTPVSRLDELPVCYAQTSRLIAWRHISPAERILTGEHAGRTGAPEYSDNNLIDPELIRGFLTEGSEEEIDGFVAQIRECIGAEALRSLLFARYMAMTVLFTAVEYLEGIGCRSGELLTPETRAAGRAVNPGTAIGYIRELLGRAVALRDRESSRQKRDLLVQTLAYVDEHYAEEGLSLNLVAKEVNISPNYLSAVFSQEEGKTFVEYVTDKRIGEAKRLLRVSDLRSSEVADAVGYRDPHYFSFVFKKITGLSPREYRQRGVG